jgi:DNA-binding CsgD family transcriptional regulator
VGGTKRKGSEGSSLRLERLVRDAQGASSLGEFRAALLASLGPNLGADSAALLDAPRTDGGPSDVRRIGSWGLSVGYEGRYARHRLRYEQSIGRLLGALERGAPVVDSEVYGLGERERLALYSEVLLPQRATSVLSAMVSYRDCRVAMLVLKRHGRKNPFGARESAWLASVVPVVALADAGFQHCQPTATPCVDKSPDRLSPREAEVAQLACKGMRNGEIAAMLGTSAETVKKQLRSVFEKIGVSNRTELAALWAAGAQRSS